MPLVVPLVSALVVPLATSLLGIHPDTSAWMFRVTANGGTVSMADAAAMDQAASVFRSVGLADTNTRLNAFVGNQLAAALVPYWRGPSGPNVDVNTNFISGDYTRATGITGNGTKKSLLVNIPQNSWTASNRHIAAYERTRPATIFASLMGSDNAPANLNAIALGTRDTGNKDEFDCSAFFSGPSEPVNALPLGLLVGSQTVSTTGNIYRNGALVLSAAVSAATPGTEPMRIFALSRAGSPTGWTTASQGGYAMGVGLTGAQVATYSAAWTALMTAFGRNV